MEEDESMADTLVSDGITGFPEHDHTARLIGKAQFIDALAGGDNGEGSEGLDMEDYVEEVDIEISSDSGSSSDDEDKDLSVTQQLYSRTMKSVKAQSRGPSRRSTKPCMKNEPRNMENTYDPLTCREWPN